MSTLIPAIRSRMGSRDYYIAKMSASSLSGQVSIASELDDWENLTLDDLYQRDLNRKRVEQDIAPYLANTADRFFGSIIILIRDHDAITFEGVINFSDNMLAAYRSHSSDIGFLTIGSRQGGLVALDGQHRLAALRHVVQGNTPGPYRDDVSNDEVAVIFISDTEISKARELFTMLNRSARKVSKNDVLIMSESDGAAIVARRLTGHLILNPRRNLENQPLVKWESNTIGQRDSQITTLNALYELAKIAAEFLGVDFDDSEENADKDGQFSLTAKNSRGCAKIAIWWSKAARRNPSTRYFSAQSDSSSFLTLLPRRSRKASSLMNVKLSNGFFKLTGDLNPVCGRESW
jgi:DNA sulfur modification protein DndB